MRGIILRICFMVMCLVALMGAGCSNPSGRGDNTASIRELDRTKETAIKIALKQDKELAGEDIKIQVVNLEATISGKVQNEEAKQRAEKIAMKVEGIKTVHNKLKVEP